MIEETYPKEEDASYMGMEGEVQEAVKQELQIEAVVKVPNQSLSEPSMCFDGDGVRFAID